MSDDPIAIGPLDVTSVPRDVLSAQGDSVLDHALRRILAVGPPGAGYSEPNPIAAHDNHV
jgi:hypothetical protein